MKNEQHHTECFFQRDRGWHPPALTPLYKTSVARSPRRAPVSFPHTLSEVTGPVFGHSILGALDNDLTVNFATPGESAIGPRIIVYGRVLDENARPVPNVLVEFWQANAGGRYRHRKDGYLAPLDPNFGGCGRTISDSEGHYFFRTIVPGAIHGRMASMTGGPRTFIFPFSDTVSSNALSHRCISRAIR